MIQWEIKVYYYETLQKQSCEGLITQEELFLL